MDKGFKSRGGEDTKEQRAARLALLPEPGFSLIADLVRDAHDRLERAETLHLSNAGRIASLERGLARLEALADRKPPAPRGPLRLRAMRLLGLRS